MDGYISDDYFMNRASTHTPKVLVAVKMLRRNADDRARYVCHPSQIENSLSLISLAISLTGCLDHLSCHLNVYISFSDVF